MGLCCPQDWIGLWGQSTGIRGKHSKDLSFRMISSFVFSAHKIKLSKKQKAKHQQQNWTTTIATTTAIQQKALKPTNQPNKQTTRQTTKDETHHATKIIMKFNISNNTFLTLFTASTFFMSSTNATTDGTYGSKALPPLFPCSVRPVPTMLVFVSFSYT